MTSGTVSDVTVTMAEEVDVTYPECVSYSVFGQPCTAGRCKWETAASQVKPDGTPTAEGRWATMVVQLCHTLPAGPVRTLVSELVEEWDGTADELVALAESVVSS